MSILKKALSLVRKVDTGQPWYPFAAGWTGYKTLGWSQKGETFDKKDEQLRQLRSWVYIAVNLISNEIAATPRKFYKKTGKTWDDYTEVDMPQDLRDALNKPFLPFGNEGALFKFWVQSLDLCGEAPIFIDTAGGAGRIIKGFIPINPSLINPDITEAGIMKGWTTSSGRRIPLEEVLFSLYPSPSDIYRGLSPIHALAGGVDLNNEIRNYSAKLIKNYGVPGVILTPEQPLDQKERDELKAWALANKGKVGDERLYPFGIKVVANGVSPRELDFVNGHRITKEEILAGYGVPEILITGKDANRSTLENATQNWLDTCIFPRLTIIEDAFNSQIIERFYGDDYWFGFDRRKIEFAEDKARNDQMALQYNLITVEEWRRANGMEEQKPDGTEPNPRTITFPPITGPIEEPEEDEEDPDEPEEKKLIRKLDRVMEWKAFDDIVRVAERPFAADVSRFFESQRKQVIDILTNAANNNQPLSIGLFSQTDMSAKLAERMKPYISNAIEAGYNRGARQAGQRLTYPGGSAYDNYIATKAKNAANEITKTTLAAVKAYLENNKIEKAAPPSTAITIEGLLEGISDIFETWKDSRATMIAETETVGSLNWGTQSGYRDSGVEYKEWLSQQDSRVRGNDPADQYDHRLDGTVIPIGARFKTGRGSSLEYPGDPSGEAGDLCNCRCTIIPAWRE